MTASLIPLQQIRFNIDNVTRVPKHTPIIITDFSLIFPTGASHKVLWEVFRDDISITNGPQILSLRDVLNAPPDNDLQVIRSASIVDINHNIDTKIKSRKHNYSVVISNNGSETLDLDYMSFIVQV